MAIEAERGVTQSTKSLKSVAPCSSVSVSPAGSSLVSSDSPASRGPSTSPSSQPSSAAPCHQQHQNEQSSSTSPMAIPFAQALKSPDHAAPVSSPSVIPPSPSPAPSSIRVATNGRSYDKQQPMMTINLPPIPVIHSSQYASSASQPIVGQKRTRTLADIRAEVAQKKQRPSVITYCQPRQQPMPVRVIKSVQKVCLVRPST